MKEHHILLIGGGGFIGTALRSCFRDKYNVHIIGRSLSIDLYEDEFYYSVTEFTYLHLSKVLKGLHFLAVIDLAYTSVPGTSYSDPVKDFSENLYTIIKNLELCRSISVGKYIYISSGGTVYGETDGNIINEEQHNFPLSPYGVTKLTCERYAYMYFKLHRVPVLIIRPSNIYGPGQKPFRGQGLISTALGGVLRGEEIQVYGNGMHVRDYLYIDDFCTAVIHIMHKGEPGVIYNVGSGTGVTINQVLHQINCTLEDDGLKLRIRYLPERPFDVHHNVLDYSRLHSLIEWRPKIELNTGISKTWKWIKEYMKNVH